MSQADSRIERLRPLVESPLFDLFIFLSPIAVFFYFFFTGSVENAAGTRAILLAVSVLLMSIVALVLLAERLPKTVVLIIGYVIVFILPQLPIDLSFEMPLLYAALALLPATVYFGLRGGKSDRQVVLLATGLLLEYVVLLILSSLLGVPTPDFLKNGG